MTTPAHLRFAGASAAEQRAALETIIRASPLLMGALEGARNLALPDTLLVAGAVYNTVWNALTARPPLHGIADVDLFYFDPDDLSYEAEDRVIQAAADRFAGLPVPVQLRNQARVYLWFPQHFGIDYPPLASSAEGVDRFTTRAHAIGLRLAEDGSLLMHAPFGLDDLFAFRLRPNRRLDNAATHRAKAARALANWPELSFEDW